MATRRSRRFGQPGPSISDEDSNADGRNSLERDSPERVDKEDLWNSFLSDDTENAKSSNDTSEQPPKSDLPKSDPPKSDPPKSDPPKTDEASDEKKVDKPIDKPKREGGLSAILSTVSRKRGISSLSDIAALKSNKNKKPSLLEQSKSDWETFKTKEGLKEELTTFNNGKAGFLQRRDFLERTDLRQFEYERDLRTKNRNSKRE